MVFGLPNDPRPSMVPLHFILYFDVYALSHWTFYPVNSSIVWENIATWLHIPGRMLAARGLTP